ncbi:POGZ-like protein, partial [Mya arenaria]
RASAEFGVPVTTIHDNTKTEDRAPRGRRLDLHLEDEASLVQWCLYMANQGMPASRVILKQKVIEIIRTYDHATQISDDDGPTYKWVQRFLTRHTILSERLAENMDSARIAMSTQEVIDQFYDLLSNVLQENGLLNKAERIFNCDEIGWMGKEKNAVKVLGPKQGHVFRKKMSGSGHITAQICASADGRIFPTLMIFPGSIPHRTIEGVPESWLFTSSESGYINTNIFHQWLMQIFIPNCGKDRPVLLLMDNHDSHVSISTLDAAIANGVILVSLPGHTTHLLQPLEVKVFGPLKARVTKIMANLGQMNSSCYVGNHKFPAILRHAIDKATPDSVQRAFQVTGICPLNSAAVHPSQIIQATFVERQKPDGTTESDAVTCPTCGRFTTNPLVARGIIPQRLADILAPTLVQSLEAKKASSRKRVERGRLLSSNEVLQELKVRKRRKENDLTVWSWPNRKSCRDEAKAARAEKRNNVEEEKAARKRAREEKRDVSRSQRQIPGIEVMGACAYICAECDGHGCVSDEENGVFWYGCDVCDRWYHNYCLSVGEVSKAVDSVCNQSDWVCKLCGSEVYEE